MNLDEFRHEMEGYRQAVEKEGEALRDSCHSLDRAGADPSFQDHHVRHFKIITALPALEKLAKRLSSSSARGADSDLEMVNRLIADLTRG